MKNEDRDKVKNEVLELLDNKEIPKVEQFIILIAVMGYIAAKVQKHLLGDVLLAYSMLGVLLQAMYDGDLKEEKENGKN